jgi:hypothetical protein
MLTRMHTSMPTRQLSSNPHHKCLCRRPHPITGTTATTPRVTTPMCHNALEDGDWSDPHPPSRTAAFNGGSFMDPSPACSPAPSGAAASNAPDLFIYTRHGHYCPPWSPMVPKRSSPCEYQLVPGWHSRGLVCIGRLYRRGKFCPSSLWHSAVQTSLHAPPGRVFLRWPLGTPLAVTCDNPQEPTQTMI